MLAKYLLVGVVNTIVGLGTIYFGMYFIGLDVVRSNLLGYTIGILVSFTLNKKWTFGSRDHVIYSFFRYLLVLVFAYVVNLKTVLFFNVNLGVNPYLAQAIGIFPYTLIGFLGSRYFVFKSQSKKKCEEVGNDKVLVKRDYLPSISVVVPAYNEQEVLTSFYNRTSAVLRDIGSNYEIVFVNDGSTDGTLKAMYQLAEADKNIQVIDLSRNFGKEIALTAGLDHAKGEVIVIIDADLQDPPELITQFIKGWQDGFDVVYAVRTVREGESWVKKATASYFYRIIQNISNIKIPRDTGDFRLISRRSLDALKQLREHHRFMKGLFAWVGFDAKPIFYKRDARLAGTTKWNYWKLWNFAIEGITSFSIAPLKIATYLGLLVAVFSFVYAGAIIYKTLMFGESVQGYPSLMVVILFLGGIQLVCIGVIGEYLGRIFNEVKKRPLYLVKDNRDSCL